MAIKEIPEQTAGKVKYEMLEIAMNIAEIYFPSEPIAPVIAEPNAGSLLNEADTKPPVRELPPVLENKPGESAFKDNMPMEPVRSVSDVARLEQLLSDMQNRLADIQQAEPQSALRYIAMHDALVTLKIKAVARFQESTLGQGQHDKAAKVLALTANLFEYTLDFMQRSTEERQASARSFFDEIHRRLTSPENSGFIDQHRNDFSGFLYKNLCSQSIFRTQTRRHLTAFEESCLQAVSLS